MAPLISESHGDDDLLVLLPRRAVMVHPSLFDLRCIDMCLADCHTVD